MDERLIELVRGHEELYDMSNKKYSDNLHKDKIWKEIGEEINKPGECARSLLVATPSLPGQCSSRTVEKSFEFFPYIECSLKSISTLPMHIYQIVLTVL